jgi:ATP-dependent RNA helicase DDX55/SPB4
MLLPLLANLSSLCTQILPLHGHMSQKKRTESLDLFAKAEAAVLLCTDVAARGIDIANVDWIVQFDAPQHSNAFVHRIGRTARAGRSGNAVVFLAPQEDAFIHYAINHKVPIQPLPTSIIPSIDNGKSFAKIPETSQQNNDPRKKWMTKEELIQRAPPIFAKARDIIKTDRALMEAGQSAFVSFIRAYKEHELNMIFASSALPLGQVAISFALLYFPKLPDLKHIQVDYPSHSEKPFTIKFADPQREKQRLANESVRAEMREQEKNEREARQLERRKQKEKSGPKRRRKRTHEEMKAEWEELQEEMRRIKKSKKNGKQAKAKNQYSDSEELEDPLSEVE